MKTVLVVDDDKDIRELIVWKLNQAGYATLAEADGEAGLKAASGETDEGAGALPDLILLDWSMPKMDGIYVCALLRANPVTARVPIILLTAKAQDSEMERGLGAGADDYIVKPFSPREMLSRVEAVLARTDQAS
jgi:two-component system phosphate regulon response regulator PhoB